MTPNHRPPLNSVFLFPRSRGTGAGSALGDLRFACRPRCTPRAAPSPLARTAGAGAGCPRAPGPRPAFIPRGQPRAGPRPVIQSHKCQHRHQPTARRGAFAPPPAGPPRLLPGSQPQSPPPPKRHSPRPRPRPRRTERTAAPPAGNWARLQACRQLGAGQGAPYRVPAAPPPLTAPWRAAQADGSPGGRGLGRSSLRYPPASRPVSLSARVPNWIREWNGVPSSSRAAS